jgi:hypothetical protein
MDKNGPSLPWFAEIAIRYFLVKRIEARIITSIAWLGPTRSQSCVGNTKLMPGNSTRERQMGREKTKKQLFMNRRILCQKIIATIAEWEQRIAKGNQIRLVWGPSLGAVDKIFIVQGLENGRVFGTWQEDLWGEKDK